MLDFLIWFILGAWVGAIGGLVIAGLCQAARRGMDD